MSKVAAFIFILSLRIFYQPSESKKDIAPFAKPSQTPGTTRHFIQAKQISEANTIYNDAISPDKKDFGNRITGLKDPNHQKVEK